MLVFIRVKKHIQSYETFRAYKCRKIISDMDFTILPFLSEQTHRLISDYVFTEEETWTSKSFPF